MLKRPAKLRIYSLFCTVSANYNGSSLIDNLFMNMFNLFKQLENECF